MLYLRSTGLYGYVDGSFKEPSQQISVSMAAGATTSTNPLYATWYNQDQLVLRGILASLTEELVADVARATTSYEAWTTMFNSCSRAKMIQLRQQLTTTKKKDLSALEYFRKMKSFASTLAAIGKPLSNDELISYILCGLGADLSSFVTSMMTRSGDLSLDEFYGYLVDQETRDVQFASEVGLGSSSANFAGRNNTNNSCSFTISRISKITSAQILALACLLVVLMAALPLVLDLACASPITIRQHRNRVKFVASWVTKRPVSGTAWTKITKDHPILFYYPVLLPVLVIVVLVKFLMHVN